ncbi:MAG: ribonuclease HII [Bacteroidota bacterium]
MENKLLSYFNADIIEAGIDEAGRGCYAGPVFAAAVILPKDFYHPLLNDSKQTKESDRYDLREVIKKQAIAWAVASVDNHTIDSINILQATFEAMHQAIGKLKKKPKFLLIDGNRFRPYPKIKHECIIQGDGLYASIAAASILAKTYRDDYMKELHLQHPHYKWDFNKGYGTPEHRAAIATHGLCCYHRHSFNIMSPQIELPFAQDVVTYDTPSTTISSSTGNFDVSV